LQLKQAVHSARDEAIVEVWDADKRTLIGVLYPTPTGVKFVSKFITNHPHLVVIRSVRTARRSHQPRFD
jgi:hypothetical protein